MCVAEGTDGKGDGRVIGRRMKLFTSSGREECLCRFAGRGLVILVPGLDPKVKVKFLVTNFVVVKSNHPRVIGRTTAANASTLISIFVCSTINQTTSVSQTKSNQISNVDSDCTYPSFCMSLIAGIST